MQTLLFARKPGAPAFFAAFKTDTEHSSIAAAAEIDAAITGAVFAAGFLAFACVF